MAELKQPIELADYLFRRVAEAGVKYVHGLPGDFNLAALDYLPKASLKWVGNCNELNAGYAADGYARVKGSMGALITTFGVGELSALNAIAGCYAEYVPVVHIVGMPSRTSQAQGALLHHSLGNGDFNVYRHMSQPISCATANLTDPYYAPSQIDETIRQCWLQSRPVYITLPTDMVHAKVEGERLKTPLDLEYPKNEKEKEDYVVDVVMKYINNAKNPVILVDACAIRHRVLSEVHALVEKSNFPTFVSPMGKSAINEEHPQYGGVYAGDGSDPGVREIVESSDLVLSIGSIKSDFNTTGFSYRISQLQTIDFHSNYVTVRYSDYPGIRMKYVLQRITKELDSTKRPLRQLPDIHNIIPKKEDAAPGDSTITHAWMWPRFGQWLKPNDVVITETGTANDGILDTRFPRGVTALSQVLWGSIGWSVGAAQGAALAAAEMGGDRRVILVVGDGSFQLTAQEVSTMIRHKLKPIIFIICNEGYTIERYIHGMEEAYNDIQPWRFQEFLSAFGADVQQSKTFAVKTKDELEALFQNKEFSSAPYIQLVELYMPKKDAPRVLKLAAASAGKNIS